MADEVKFPIWHKPDANVGAILVHSQDELDALNEAGWPHPKKHKHVEDDEPKAKPGPKPKK